MNKYDAILGYKTSMCVFKNWLANGLITEDELRTIDTIITEKYGLSLSSIYRGNELICSENRANIGVNLYK